MGQSRHSKWMTIVDGKQRIFRNKGDRYDVLEFVRYSYTAVQTDKVSKLIRANLTDDLISDDIREKYPEDHPRWKYPFFGHCVPATFISGIQPTQHVPPSTELQMAILPHMIIYNLSINYLYLIN